MQSDGNRSARPGGAAAGRLTAMSGRQTLRVATRASTLAVRQSEWVIDRLRRRWPDLRLELVKASTPGDRDKQTPLTSLGQGVFVSGVERLLLEDEADVAVHSLKDVPTLLTAGLELAAFPERADPRDGLVCRVGHGLTSLPIGALVGTGSPRRAAQLLALRPDLRVAPVRGNLDTRLRKLREGAFDALMLAVAGLARLGRDGELDQVFSAEECTPATGQGALVVQCRADDDLTRRLVSTLDDRTCRAEVTAERAFLAALGGGCQLPAGALGTVDGDDVDIIGVAASPDGREIVRQRHRGPSTAASVVGHELGEHLLPHARGLLGAAAGV